MSSLTTATTGAQDFFTRNAICQVLGINKRTIFRWLSSNQFPQADIRIGRVHRWKRETLEAWIENKTLVNRQAMS